MKPLLEKDIEKILLEELNSYPYAKFWKNESQGTYDAKKGVYRRKGGKNKKYSQYGSSDILGVLNGRFFAIEVKRPQNKTRPEHQVEFINEINYCGGVAFFCDNLLDLQIIMKPYVDQVFKEMNEINNE